MSEAEILDKARGSVYGLCVGDALGATNEFSNPKYYLIWPELMTGGQTDILGGGPFKVKRGQITDDSQMAICIAKALKDNNGIFSEDLIAKNYMEWYKDLFDGGNTTLTSIRHLISGISPKKSGEMTWLESDKNASGNGSLMRTAIIGAFHSMKNTNRKDLLYYTFIDGSITHFDFRCQLSCAVYNSLIDGFIQNTITNKNEIEKYCISSLHTAEKILNELYPCYSDIILKNSREIEHDINVGCNSLNPMLYGEENGIHIIKTQGFVRVAFRLALWELLHTDNYKTALIDVVNRGGDSDTNGAIVGGLLGAFYGENAIPQEWRNTVENCFSDDPTGFWGDTYHPRRMFELFKII